MKYLISALSGILLMTSCQKEHTCNCFNPGGTFKTHKISGTKKKAREKCAEYAKEYQDVPMSETGCAIQ